MSSMQCRASSAGSLVLRYRAGMITSVSTSSPYFQALPRYSMRSAPLDLVGAADPAQHRRRGGVGEIDLALGMPHPPHEIPVRGGNRPLPLGEDPHVPAEAGAACRRGEGR